MAGRLQDKVAIITGSNSGIGEATAIIFASQGAKVTLCGRDKDRLRCVLEKVVQASGGHKDRFITFAGDLTEQGVRKEIIDHTVKTFGRLDILVANAGINVFNQSLSTATEEIYDHIMDTNLKSVFFLIQLAVPHLEKSKGNIITISSTLSVYVSPMLLIYSILKAALNHLTSCLAVDLGTKGIRVNSVLPGYIHTNLGRSLGDKSDSIADAVSKLNNAQKPLRERDLNVNDIAEAVAFLASDAAGCITGEHVKVDGGRSYGGFLDTSKLLVQ